MLFVPFIFPLANKNYEIRENKPQQLRDLIEFTKNTRLLDRTMLMSVVARTVQATYSNKLGNTLDTTERKK